MLIKLGWQGPRERRRGKRKKRGGRGDDASIPRKRKREERTRFNCFLRTRVPPPPPPRVHRALSSTYSFLHNPIYIYIYVCICGKFRTFPPVRRENRARDAIPLRGVGISAIKSMRHRVRDSRAPGMSTSSPVKLSSGEFRRSS